MTSWQVGSGHLVVSIVSGREKTELAAVTITPLLVSVGMDIPQSCRLGGSLRMLTSLDSVLGPVVQNRTWPDPKLLSK